MSVYYRVGRYPFLGLLRLLCRIDVDGLEHIPAEGPFILVPNHESLGDPILVQVFCPRQVYSMTKSTQFASPFFRWVLPRILAFPVRRYRVDPQAVRVTLRVLDEGGGVCIYPEGERSWDGRLQPFRRGALRVLLRSGVPVIPVGIRGMYQFWPRWLKRPRVVFKPRMPVTLRFGEPMELGRITDRDERERRLPELERRLRTELLRLTGRTEAQVGADAPEGSPVVPGS